MSHLPPAFEQNTALAHFMRQIGPCPLPLLPKARPHQSPYHSLIRAVTGQQLHNAAAESIFKRLCSLSSSAPLPPDAQTLCNLSDETLRGCGLSFAKINTLRAIAHAQEEGDIPSLEEAHLCDDETLISRLTTLKGVGRWTVEMMLIFTLYRPDIFPAGDYGVQEGWRRLTLAPHRLSPSHLRKITSDFAPYRSVLTWYCWQAKAMLPPPTSEP